MQAKVFSILALLQLASANPLLAARARCNANDCYRQAVASSAKPFHASAVADCSKFLLATVTPCPSTTTVTSGSTVTSTVTGAAPLNKRGDLEARAACTPVTSSGTAVPTYASSCANYAAYSSACSCGNSITASTTTLTAQTSTVTVQPTATATVVPVHQIVNPNDATAFGFRDPNDSSLVIGVDRPAQNFFIDSQNLLRHYESGLYIVARDDSTASGPNVYQYFIGDPESGIIPNVFVSGTQLGLSLNDQNYKFCFLNDNGVLGEPEKTTCRFPNDVQYVNWIPSYAPARA